MRIPKRYGESRNDSCPFCDKQALAKNKQGLLVCLAHKETNLPDIKCLCGSWLDIRTGKYGPYFFCINCGNINLKKGLEMLEYSKKKQEKNNPEKKEEIQKPKISKTNVSDKPLQKKEKVHYKKSKDEFIVDTGKYDNFDYGIE
ncbi:hypothetical protein HON01_11775 [Candidatus Woesearchaeota archaeon]|jgi:hypothetical protein|nr:hypothetical protein [archaeon]MBT5023491.1 hypothetical protein [Candidatus Woesearchaeota archaeon]MBT4022602.1 hypothetical protein [archaeon]MBT4272042.1 hypothetical protein [archaeon]MBT4461139.1 hypothetical protein [archaeon]